jgi:hypothetical protein
MYSFFYNQVLMQIDFLYKFKINVFFKLPLVKFLEISFSIKDVFKYLDNFLNLKFSLDSVNSNVYLLLMLFFSSTPSVFFKKENLVKFSKINNEDYNCFCKLLISNKFLISFFMLEFFEENYYTDFFFLYKRTFKKLPKNLFLHKHISLVNIDEIDTFVNSLLPINNTKDLIFNFKLNVVHF